MDLRERLTRLAHLERAATPVVSVYLGTRWRDEHQRERARIFVKNEVRRAREGNGAAPHPSDLAWVEAETHALIDHAGAAETDGVALFACHAAGLRETLRLRVPFEECLVVAPTPYLLPLAAALDRAPAALVVFVDTERARLVPLDAAGPAEEVALETEVPGRHSRGGWAQLAQSRYQRHIQDHRHRHFEAVAESLCGLVDANGVERIVLAGEPRNLAIFRSMLPGRIAVKVTGTVEGSRHEPTRALVARASELIGEDQHRRRIATLDVVLTEAAKSGQAVAGIGETLEAVNRGAVHRLFVAASFVTTGTACESCGILAQDAAGACGGCGRPTRPVALAPAMSERVLAAGGYVEVVDGHARLRDVGGVAALLRYPL